MKKIMKKLLGILACLGITAAFFFAGVTAAKEESQE